MTTVRVIPQCNPLAAYHRHDGEIDEAVRRVLRSGRYLMAEETAAFEAEFAAYLGVAHSVAVSSGTDALLLALKACGIGPGDEVITVAHTAVATVAAIALCGATPVFADIDPSTFTLDPLLLPGCLTPRTRAIIPVHLYGYAAPMPAIMEFAGAHDLRVIEDCAQAHGAGGNGRMAGAYGDAAAFSFYPTKNLAAFGDAGLVATSDPVLADRIRLLRQYGWRERYISTLPGQNARMDELQAAILRVKLRALDAGNFSRRALASLYRTGLRETPVKLPPESTSAVFHQFVIRTPRRDELQSYLKKKGASTLIHYPVPIHQQPAYKQDVSLIHTEEAARTVLSLPIFPELSEPDAAHVASLIRDFRPG